MPRPVHFEIHAAEPERAIGFYEKLFGWTFTKWDGPMPYWLIRTGEPGTTGIDGGLLPRKGPAPTPGQAVIAYICTIGVEHLDDTKRTAQSLGSSVCLDKMPIPGVGWLAYLSDTEGNIFGVMQSDSSAR